MERGRGGREKEEEREGEGAEEAVEERPKGVSGTYFAMDFRQRRGL